MSEMWHGYTGDETTPAGVREEGVSEKCCAISYDPHASWGGKHRQCRRQGKVEVGGNWYCGIHDPAKVAEREAKSRANSEARTREWVDEQNDRIVGKYLRTTDADTYAALLVKARSA